MQFPVFLDTIASIPISALAQQYGTPLYVYDAAKIAARIADLRQFDVIRYAQKACSNLAILQFMREQGCLVDTVSAWEIRRALAAGFPDGSGNHAQAIDGTKPDQNRSPGMEAQCQLPPAIFYTADIFDREALDLVVEHSIAVNCGSPDMIDQLGARVPGHPITLRINPGFGHGHSQKTNTGGEESKHGIWHEQVDACIDRAARYDMIINGLHMHIGSGTDFEHLGQVCQAMENSALAVGSSIRTISAGGGLPIPYREEEEWIDVPRYFSLWNATRDRLSRALGHAVRLEIEPGRYLTAESGYLIAEIRAVKQMGRQLYYLLDAGFNNLARPILYGAYHPMAIVGGKGRPLQEVVVGGPLCESGDIFTQRVGGFVTPRTLPQAAVGDYLVILNVGAYGFVMSNNYNSKPLAAEALIQNGQHQLIRRRQVFEDLIAPERF